ncbi:tegument protein U67 [Elephant endotheliotropic herpesvirus 1A]|uniref:U67 n=2 Tax=Elephantid herpesvirus 1 TaxID=146015 RepID=E2IKX9_ELHV1|nr:protein UL95 [Elephantid betaherpesvirus 1]ADK70805.1 U67 [Elephant endotheliotropic herpesvirus 1A]AGE10060.1 protein UL95 [Elephantid betaherpesvirus 1]AGG16103.1 tegument protein U67 [Elephant endotheliotropic herpesvirus 1A]QEY96032.1 protein UL95 [Elephant endotheliotropic herpesvirus 1A]QOE74612.1 tegument protein U67 [Elephant endotheliotropic herpesvirus 1A]
MDWLCKLEEDWKDSVFRDAVKDSLDICGAISPNERFTFVETPHHSFLLVTNILPDEHGVIKDKKLTPGDIITPSVTSVPVGNAKDLNHDIYQSSESSNGKTVLQKGCLRPNNSNYLMFNAKHIPEHHTLFTNAYVSYSKEDIQTSLSFNKSAFISKILSRCNVPGILDHNNVIHVDMLLWLLFAGPLSCCSRTHCFGYTRPDIRRPFPVVLPPILYNDSVDIKMFVNMAEIYVYGWYGDDKIKSFETTFFKNEELQAMIGELRAKYVRKSVPLWHVNSRICLFCALYLQNRLCLENLKHDVNKIPLSPIIIQDCVFNDTNISCQPTVAVGHITPGTNVTKLFPVYQLDKLLSYISLQPDGTCVITSP